MAIAGLPWSSQITTAAAPPTPAPPAAPPAPSPGAAGGGGGDIVTTTNALAFPYFPGMGFPSNAGIPVTPLTAMQSAAVYGCCKCIAEDIAGLQVQIRRATDDGGWVIDRGHMLNRLFRRPNRWQPRFHFWVFVLVAYALRGNAYMVILRNRVGQPVELVPVWPDSVGVHPPVTGGDRVWYTVTSRFLGGTYRVPSENMVHMMNMSFDGFVGLSPIACAQDVVGLALATQQHGAILFRQGGQVGGVLTHPAKIGDEAKNSIAQSWRDVHSGVQNAHKMVVLEEGMKYEKIALTNEDAQFLQCLAAGTLVTTEHGTRVPIEELKPGHKIMAWEDGRVVARRVAKVGQPPIKPMVRITTYRGRTLTCTADHPCLGLLSLRTPGGRPVADEPHWYKAGDLEMGNYLRVAFGHTTEDRGHLAPESAWLLGYLAGNGYVREGSCALSLSDRSIADVVQQVIADLGGSLVPRPKPWDFEIRTGGIGRGGSPLRSLFNAFETGGAHTRRVPLNVVHDGPTSWAWFLSGYLDADGTVTHEMAKQPMVSWSSVSREMLDDCQHLLAMLGLQSGIYPMRPEGSRMMPNGKIADCRDLWCLCITGRRTLARLAGLLYPCSAIKAPRLAAFADLAASRYRPVNWLYDRIKSVEALGDGESFGIEVEGCHTHVTNGLVTHNTRQFQVLDICRLYRVPPHKLAEYGRATFNNLEQQQQQYIDDCLQPHTDQLSDILGDGLLFSDERADYQIRFDYSSLLTGDMNTRYTAYQTGLNNGFLNRNEVRAREGMNPIPGGDEYRVPLNTGNPMDPTNAAQQMPRDGDSDGQVNEGNNE